MAPKVRCPSVMSLASLGLPRAFVYLVAAVCHMRQLPWNEPVDGVEFFCGAAALSRGLRLAGPFERLDLPPKCKRESLVPNRCCEACAQITHSQRALLPKPPSMWPHRCSQCV